jgi:hypothetical protein
MKKLGLLTVLLVCLSFSGEDPRKIFEFDQIVFRIGKLSVSMSPVFGKQYGVVEAIDVSWESVKIDPSGRIAIISDNLVVPVRGDKAKAYFEAKLIFRQKQIELLKQFENAFLLKK